MRYACRSPCFLQEDPCGITQIRDPLRLGPARRDLKRDQIATCDGSMRGKNKYASTPKPGMLITSREPPKYFAYSLLNGKPNPRPDRGLFAKVSLKVPQGIGVHALAPAGGEE